MEAKLRDSVPAVEQVGVVAMSLVRTGSLREEVVRVARVDGVDSDVNGPRQRIR